jgi:hypothetical protein
MRAALTLIICLLSAPAAAFNWQIFPPNVDGYCNWPEHAAFLITGYQTAEFQIGDGTKQKCTLSTPRVRADLHQAVMQRLNCHTGLEAWAEIVPNERVLLYMYNKKPIPFFKDCTAP